MLTQICWFSHVEVGLGRSWAVLGGLGRSWACCRLGSANGLCHAYSVLIPQEGRGEALQRYPVHDPRGSPA